MTKAERVILDVLRRQKSAMTRDDIVDIARTMYKGGIRPLWTALADLAVTGRVESEQKHTYRIKEADNGDTNGVPNAV